MCFICSLFSNPCSIYLLVWQINHKISVVQHQRSLYLVHTTLQYWRSGPSQGSLLSSQDGWPFRPCPRCCSIPCGTPGSSAASACLGKSEQREFTCSLQNSGSVSLLPHFIVQNMEYLATRGMFDLRGQFPPSNHSDNKFLVTESFWEFAAISFILWVTLLGRIISFYWQANQDLEISNNATWLSGIIRIPAQANQNSLCKLTLEPVSHTSTCPDAMLINLLFTWWSSLGSAISQNHGVSTLYNLFWEAA